MLIVITLNGRVVRVEENTTTVVGCNEAARLIAGLSTNYFEYVAVGSGASLPTPDDTALEAEVMRVLATRTLIPDYVIRYEASFNISTDFTLREVGIFNDASGGVLLARGKVSDLPLLLGDTLNITWDIRVEVK